MEKNSSTYTINNIERTMRYISGIIKQNGRKILTNYPITSPQFVALQWLVENEELTIGELSNKISLAFSTTTDLVDRMEKNELVERVKDSKDKRVVRIRVLDKGRQIIQEVIEKRQVYLGEVLEDFTEEQTESLNELLDFLHEQMRKVNNK
ncbi:MarR family winged helix-turn-helix transcriptional regulator [Virgibacillus halodenitrificans]|uniref:MarR family transcriptional regulator n=2 Tax=Virgibacillus halodenitrificans TaxID=1482 RepID=A0AAC9NKW2_VIRHA|nr:MarR family transcriptional regulator [Virgibacillus halodenitrificans]APC48099.1 MarR family transcriptional regulator [Virgibacillus halodenitrificans]MCJ0931674.1 MarR family transcriptional regulator [Virgibacillus halodenitrificans]MEC2159927.1 MarR family transcriptional regulator [Virgibacillus halodenitrificans]MYL44872.1 MarR family transcriptional regulator [Virgibacillus halodenitrificans]MYL55993.1 MarR family transcriptional regulator [Virgibacillus halodenitrificans]